MPTRYWDDHSSVASSVDFASARSSYSAAGMLGRYMIPAARYHPPPLPPILTLSMWPNLCMNHKGIQGANDLNHIQNNGGRWSSWSRSVSSWSAYGLHLIGWGWGGGAGEPGIYQWFISSEIVGKTRMSFVPIFSEQLFC